MINDNRYNIIRKRYETLSLNELILIRDNIDNLCFDTYNYDEEAKKFCPLAVALNIHKTLENPTDFKVKEEIAKRFNPVNIIKGIEGKFFKQNRKEDILNICNELIELKNK